MVKCSPEGDTVQHAATTTRERKGERCHSAGGILDFELVAPQAAGCHASS